MKKKIAIVLLVVFCILCALGIEKSTQTPKTQSFQVIEKGESSRFQYTVGSNTLSPGFKKIYYIILRDYDTGKEITKVVSEQEYNEFYMLGDTVTQIIK